MKKNILVLIMALTAIAGRALAADENKPVEVTCYEVDGELVYEISGCVPGSDIGFYSRRWGGVHLKDATVDNDGSIKIVADEKFTPALVANLDYKNSNGITGSGMVSTIGDKEFAINNLQVQNKEGSILLNWNAAVKDMDRYVFEVLKSVNGSGYELVTTVIPSEVGMTGYSYTDNVQKEDFVSYQIRVSNKKGVNYTSRSLVPDTKCDILLYPTVSSDNIYTSVGSKMNAESYKIVDMQGKMVLSGKIGDTKAGISVKNLAAGHYIFQIAGQKQNCMSKFVKQ